MKLVLLGNDPIPSIAIGTWSWGIGINGGKRYSEISRFSKKYGHLEDRVTQSQIASYLGITPVSLSRIRRTISEKL